jgi:hypothetical protein
LPPTKKARRYRVSKKEDLEEHLVNFCTELRAKSLPINLSILFVEASRFNDNTDIKVSIYWLWKMLRRNGFSNRRVSSFGRKSYDQTAIDDFLAVNIPKMSTYRPECIMNMDETSVQFEVVPRHTFDFRGSSTTRLSTAGLERKCFTVVLTITAAGQCLKPFVIHKRKTVPHEAKAS